jgi:hypothetical protein
MIQPVDIDVVYTWVNHLDPAWRDMYQRAVAERPTAPHEHESVDSISRFTNRDELYHSIQSLHRYAPWVRRIHVLTNCAAPIWASPFNNVHFVRHEQVFPDLADLPTFNSRAIETCLHRIPGLSDHFLYFNDDVFLLKPKLADDFFWGEAGVYLFPTRHLIPDVATDIQLRPADNRRINDANLIERDFGHRPQRKLHHAAFALNKHILTEIETKYENEVVETRRHRFRDQNDVGMATTLHAYYAESTGRGKQRNIMARYVDIGDPLFLLLVHPWSPLMRGKYDFLCLNEVGDVTHFRELRERVVAWVMKKLIGNGTLTSE